MSTLYQSSKDVPTEILSARLNQLSHVVSSNRERIDAEFTMRIPPEVDRDADLVMSEAAVRIEALQAECERLRDVAGRMLQRATARCAEISLHSAHDATLVPAIPDESILKGAYWDFDARVKGYPPYITPCGQPEHAFVVAVQQAITAAAPPPEGESK